MVITAPGFVAREFRLYRGEGEGEEAPLPPDQGIFPLLRRGRLQGRVLGPDGKPLAAAPLTVMEIYHCGLMTTTTCQQAISDAEGKFVIEGVPPGDLLLKYPWDGPSKDELASGRWKAWAKPGQEFPSAPVKGIGAAVPLQLADGQVLDDVVLDLSQSKASIEGRVIDKDAKAVAGAEVSLCWKVSQWGATTWSPVSTSDGNVPVKTDAQGRYRLQNLPPGDWCLTAKVSNASVTTLPLHLSQSPTLLDMVLPVVRTASGRIRHVQPMNEEEAVREWIDATLAGDTQAVQAVVVPQSPFARNMDSIKPLLGQIKTFSNRAYIGESVDLTTNEVDRGNGQCAAVTFKLIKTPEHCRIMDMVDEKGVSLVADAAAGAEASATQADPVVSVEVTALPSVVEGSTTTYRWHTAGKLPYQLCTSLGVVHDGPLWMSPDSQLSESWDIELKVTPGEKEISVKLTKIEPYGSGGGTLSYPVPGQPGSCRRFLRGLPTRSRRSFPTIPN